MKLSVVIPFFNGNKFLNECLFSVFLQSEGLINEVLLVVDNHSEAPDLFETKLPLKIIYNPEESNGAGVCRYYGFLAANSQYVMFLDPDDRLIPDSIDAYIQDIEESGLAFAFADYQDFDNSGNIKTYTCNNFKPSIDDFLSKSFVVGCLTVVIDKHQIDNYPKNYLKKRNDYYAWYQIIEYCISKKLLWRHVPRLVSQHRVHNESLTSNKLSAAVWQWRFLKHTGQPLVRRVYFFFSYAVRGFSRKYA